MEGPCRRLRQPVKVNTSSLTPPQHSPFPNHITMVATVLRRKVLLTWFLFVKMVTAILNLPCSSRPFKASTSACCCTAVLFSPVAFLRCYHPPPRQKLIGLLDGVPPDPPVSTERFWHPVVWTTINHGNSSTTGNQLHNWIRDTDKWLLTNEHDYFFDFWHPTTSALDSIGCSSHKQQTYTLV